MLLACSACSLGYLINTEMVSYQDSPHSFDQLLLYHKEKKKSTTSTTLREDGDAIASRNTLWQERNLKYVTVRAGQKVLFCLLSTSLCSF